MVAMMRLSLLLVAAAILSSGADALLVRLGSRPNFLVRDMANSPLKTSLQKCVDDPTMQYMPHDFSIGHRGAALHYPEHTAESFTAAIEQGAGIIECDVAVTKDGELVCRHAQCDLHTTTNILGNPALAAKCTTAFTPATATTGASARCCTSDITLAEFMTLTGKMDASDKTATTATAYMGGTADFRTDLYVSGKSGTLVTHAQSVALIKKYNRKATPELKTYTPGPGMPTYDAIRAKVVKDYTDAAFPAADVWLQSFNYPDVEYWVRNGDAFGRQAVLLDGNYTDGTTVGMDESNPSKAIGLPNFVALKAAGFNWIAPPQQMLLKNAAGKFAPSDYAKAAKAAGMNIIAWTLERSGHLASGGGWYYSSVNALINNDGDMMEMMHVLHAEVGVKGVFSDWPATTTFYANCMIKKEISPCTNNPSTPISVGPRPRFLVDDMADSTLKTALSACIEDDTMVMHPHDFSIGHRGAALHFPEHTAESYTAAIEQGAGIIECDVAVTKDGELVCRHAQCDLHTTTNILGNPALAAKCTTAFTPATATTGASARCCTSDITLAEFKTLTGKMDASDKTATTATAYMGGTADFRTDLYVSGKSGTLVTHAQSVALIKKYNRKATPELKTYTPGPGMPTYDAIRAKVVRDYTDAAFPAANVWLQSFNYPDVEYWVRNGDAFGRQAVLLDGNYTDGTTVGMDESNPSKAIGLPNFVALKAAGFNWIAPPQQMLLKNAAGKFAPSDYAKAAKAAGMNIIAWTLERSGHLASGGGWYYSSVNALINNDGDMMEMMHVLHADVGVKGVFSDWPATTTFYANCMIKKHTCSALTIAPNGSSANGVATILFAIVAAVFAVSM